MVFFIFIQILKELSESKQWRPASDLGVLCLPMSHSKDGSLKRIKQNSLGKREHVALLVLFS